MTQFAGSVSVLLRVACLAATAIFVFGGIGCSREQPPAQLPSAKEDDPRKASGDTSPEKIKEKKESADRVEPYPFKRAVVLAIGIDRYPQLRGLGNLRFAEADAKGVAEVLEKLYRFEVVSLCGAAASKREIELTLKKLGDELGEGDILLVYFAGHGQVIPIGDGKEAGYLIPADADLDANDYREPERWTAQALNMEYLSELIDRMEAQHVLFVADACCSGFMTTRGGVARADLKSFLFKRSRAVFAATTQRQNAREDSSAKHGYFTAAFLDELRRDEAMSVVDLFGPVLRQVAEKTNGRMTPRLGHFGDGEGMFVFVPKSIPRSELEADLNGRKLAADSPKGLSGVAARQRDRLARQTTEAEAYETLVATPYDFSPRAEELRQKWERRFNRFRENAAMGDAWAMAALHSCYRSGLGTTKDPDLAYFWARQLGTLTIPAGIGSFYLGECHRLGLHVPKQDGAAQKLYQGSADRGFLLAQVKLAERTLQKPSLTADEIGAVMKVFEAGRERKYSTAACDVAAMHLNGEKYPGLKSDPAKAVVVYEEAASWGGDVQARIALYATLRKDHPGLPKDLKRAEKNLREAADLGSATAQLYLAREYCNNDTLRILGLPSDVAVAFHWATLAAEQGNAGGQLMVARSYLFGFGTKINIEEAKAWCEKSANQNYPDALYLQGTWYSSGRVYGIKSNEKAIEYYTRAADLDHSVACVELAKLLDFERTKFKEHNPHWLKILHYTAKAATLGAIDTKAATSKLLDAYLSYVNVFEKDREKRWVQFWQTYPETAAIATKILKENTKRLDWFDPESVKSPNPN